MQLAGAHVHLDKGDWRSTNEEHNDITRYMNVVIQNVGGDAIA